MKTLELAWHTADEGTYVSVMPSRDSLLKLFPIYKKFEKYTETHILSNVHCTVLYSKDNLENPNKQFLDMGLDPKTIFKATPLKLEYWPGHKEKGVVVILLDSPDLQAINKKLMDDWKMEVSFPDYKPHLTVADNILKDMSEEKVLKLLEKLNKKLRKVDLELTGIHIENVS